MGTIEIIAAAAAVVSAIGGTFAAIAAIRSAKSAQTALQTMANAEHRAALRQISITATEILNEAKWISSRGKALKLAYQHMFVACGQKGGSREAQCCEAVDEQVTRSTELSEYAKLFVSNPGKLDCTHPEETDRVLIRISETLTEIRALREAIERDFCSAHLTNE